MTLRNMTTEDLLAIRVVHDPRVSPDANAVAYVHREADRERDTYRAGLRVVQFDGGPERVLTDGPVVDHSPRWSPDGRWIAFVSNRSGTDQLWVVGASEGGPHSLTALPGGVSVPAWSPAGRRLAFMSRLPGPSTSHPTAPGVHVITRLKYKTDRTGLWDGKYAHLHVLEFDSHGSASASVAITHGEHDVQFPAWSPDGARLAFLANPSPDADESATLDVWTVDLRGGTPSRVTQIPGPKAGLTWSPDAAYLAYAGHEDPSGGYHATWGLWTVPAAGGSPRRVTHNDVGFGDRMLTDLFGFDWAAGPLWAGDGRLYALANVRGATHLLAVTPETGAIETVSPGDWHVYAFDVRDEIVVWAAASPTRAPALYAGPPSRSIAEPNHWLEEVQMPTPEAFVVRSPDGVECEAWLLLPRGAQDPHPLILHVHGGPHAQYGYSFMHEFQVLAASGFAVLYANPRGSTGYGDKFAGASRRAWGQGDFADLMAAVDYLKGDPRVDLDRLGITGGSYGGFMTNWIIAQTDRFKAAVADRSLSNLVSFMGTSEIAQTFGICELDRVTYEAPVHHLASSPLTFADRIRAPLLILHSERDQQTPIEQAEQLYLALKLRQHPVEFVRFEDETHELSRSGRPSRRLVRLYHLLRWFDRYLIQ